MEVDLISADGVLGKNELPITIDLNSIIKTTLELAQESRLEELLCKLMSFLLESTGAQKGSLFLLRESGWHLEVQCSSQPAQYFSFLSIPLDKFIAQVDVPNVPTLIIDYVIKEQNDLVISDASATQQFGQDPYIRDQQPKSILCMPLLNQSVLCGVVYLENDLRNGAFTTDQLEIVRLISSQAMVSIEKARLYENLATLVEERTRELTDTNRMLKEEISERIRIEDALRLSEERYRAVFENTGTAEAVIDEEGYILFTNDEFVRLSGYTKAELENHFDSLKLVTPADAARIRQIRKTRQSDPATVPASFEFTLVDRSGMKKAVINTATVLPGSHSIIISLIDNTQRKQTEDELQSTVQDLIVKEEELRTYNEELSNALHDLSQAHDLIEAERQRFRDLFDSAPDAYLVTDIDGKIIGANRAADRLFGSDSKSLNGKLLIKFFSTLDRRTVRISLNRMASQGGEKGLKGGYRDWEAHMKKWDKSPFNASITVAPVHGYNGGPTTLRWLVRDITKQKIAEEALRYNEAILRKALEILPVGVWILDKTSKVISGNPEALRIWAGARYVDLQDFGDYVAWRTDNGKRIKAAEWAGGLAVTKGKTTLDEELEIEAFDGTHRTILNSAIPLAIGENELIGALVVNQDITKRKQDSRELQLAHDQLSTLLEISQSIASTLDLDRVLNLIIEQVGIVIPYEAAAILILEQNFLRFQVVRGPSIFHGLLKYQFSIREQTMIEPLIKTKEAFYFPDIRTEDNLVQYIKDKFKIPYDQLSFLRTWLALPLIAKDDLVGVLFLAHSNTDFYSSQSRSLSQAYANQVAIAIQNAQLYQKAHDVAALEERNRLARELHDSVAQALYSISLFTDATKLALQTNKLDVVTSHLDELVELSREAMSDMRLMIFELRPPIIEQEGLAVALQSRLDSVEARAGFQAVFHSEGEIELSPDQEGEMYRIAQEALNNVIKHAHAMQVKVQLIAEEDSIWMSIEDDGIGFDPNLTDQAGGQGIRNMRERAEKLGANCVIESAPDHGAKITIRVKK
jgi:PAS domain S-box-containing protein